MDLAPSSSRVSAVSSVGRSWADPECAQAHSTRRAPQAPAPRRDRAPAPRRYASSPASDFQRPGVICHDASSRFKFLLKNQLLKFLPELHFVLVCCQLASPARIAGRCVERRGQGGCAFDGSRRLTALGTFALFSKLILVETTVESINFRSNSRAQLEGPCVERKVRAHARSTGADGLRDIRRKHARRITAQIRHSAIARACCMPDGLFSIDCARQAHCNRVRWPVALNQKYAGLELATRRHPPTQLAASISDWVARRIRRSLRELDNYSSHGVKDGREPQRRGQYSELRRTLVSLRACARERAAAEVSERTSESGSLR